MFCRRRKRTSNKKNKIKNQKNNNNKMKDEKKKFKRAETRFSVEGQRKKLALIPLVEELISPPLSLPHSQPESIKVNSLRQEREAKIPP